MITAPLIDWQPIANMPDDRKDGRAILLWDDYGQPRVGVFDQSDYYGEPFGWADSQEAGARISPALCSKRTNA